MTSREVRDMLGLGPADVAQRKRPSKKGKAAAKRPDGMARELFALIGEREPPIPIVTVPKQYKAKLQKPNENVRWLDTPFKNPVRQDELLLRHWVRKILDVPGPAALPTSGTVASADDKLSSGQPSGTKEEETKETDQKEAEALPAAEVAIKPEPQVEEYRFTKYNLQVETPKYTDEEYSAHFGSQDWTREETDYLMELYSDFYGKWPLVIDRWDFKPSETTESKAADEFQPKARTMEELKSRFYEVAAKVMSIRTPVSNMTAAEFEDHEKMTKFNAEAEAKRKRAVDVLQHRSVEDRKEEEYLLAELRRIWTQQDRFATQLKELRDRLDHSLTDDKGQAGSFTTHAEITALFQKVVANDRNKKRRPQDGPGANGSPTTGPNVHPGHRGSIAAASVNAGEGAAVPKRQSTGGHNTGPAHRQLGPRQEARFGVSSHERLTSGVTFRSEKLNKVRQAKSQAQMKKIADVLAELGVPEIIQMPTEPVTEAMEKLVAKVHLLLDARKMREKEENEILIEKQRRDIRDGKTTDEANKPKQQEEEDEDEGDDTEVQPPKREDDDDDDDDDQDGDNGNEEADEDEENAGEDQDEQDDVEAEGDGEDDNSNSAEEDEDQVNVEDTGEGDEEFGEDDNNDEEDEEDDGDGDGDGDEDEDEDGARDLTVQSEDPTEFPDGNDDLEDDGAADAGEDVSSRPGTRNGKRSASELSDGSITETKRQKK